MKITTARRISQAFFFIITVWFCVVTAPGIEWWQLRGWPVNWIIQLDPLAGLGTLLATHSIHSGLIWGLVTIILTILLGRFFCGWLCPFGTLHQLTGYIANRKKSPARKAENNRYKSAQNLKYIILIFLLTAAMSDFLTYISGFSKSRPLLFWSFAAAFIVFLILLSLFEIMSKSKTYYYFIYFCVCALLAFYLCCLKRAAFYLHLFRPACLIRSPFFTARSTLLLYRLQTALCSAFLKA